MYHFWKKYTLKKSIPFRREKINNSPRLREKLQIWACLSYISSIICIIYYTFLAVNVSLLIYDKKHVTSIEWESGFAHRLHTFHSLVLSRGAKLKSRPGAAFSFPCAEKLGRGNNVCQATEIFRLRAYNIGAGHEAIRRVVCVTE